jgi:four helix bundle protein
MNTYETKAAQLEDRTVTFSVAVVQTCGKYAQEPALRPLINQIIRSATSVGANYSEANNASSKADFRNKIYIAKKEAAETRYWLKVLTELLPQENFGTLMQEALELNLILQKIVSTIKNGETNGK